MTDDLLVETAEKLMADLCSPAALAAAEAVGWAPQAWSAIAEVGLPWISVPESAGGQGGTLAEACDVLRVAGRNALPLPLAETGLLGGWLLASCGLTVGDGPITVVPGRSEDSLSFDGTRLSGIAHRVPWAAAVEQIVALVADPEGTQVVVIDPATASIESRRNLAGEPRDTVRFAASPVLAHAPAELDGDALTARGALTRVVLMAGAAERVLHTTLRYTGERSQFGRPVARFQAVQEHLVNLAQQSAILDMAAELAVREVDRGAGVDEVRLAKTLAGEAVRIATRAAHQAHGAMGMTEEYPLHLLTRRLWAWAHEYGESSRWANQVGARVAAGGADQFWPLITGSR